MLNVWGDISNNETSFMLKIKKEHIIQETKVDHLVKPLYVADRCVDM